ncbi:MAG: AraC family transcriptional regulator ligand-binding domain-containing protein [Methyloligellaceae bacterium]
MVLLANSATLGLLCKVLDRIGRPQYLENVLAHQGLPLQLLDAPDILFPLSQLPTVFESTLRTAGVHALARHAHGLCRFSDLGLFGRYVTAAPDLETALCRAHKAHRYHASGSTFGLDVQGRRVRWSYHSVANGWHGWRHVADLTAVLLTDLVRGYAGPRWRPAVVEVDYPEPAHSEDLEAVLEAPVLYNRPSVAIAFERDLLSRPRQWCGTSVGFGDLRRLVVARPPADFAGIVRKLIQLRLLDGHTDIDGVAVLLDMGARTLQRRLREQGPSYRDVLVEARMRRAVELLTLTREPIAEVAFSLGYSSATHMSRAFKRSLGRTPSELRASDPGRLSHMGARQVL